MTTHHRRLIGRAYRRRAQGAPLLSQGVVMAMAVDRPGPALDRIKGLLAPFFRRVIEAIEADDAAARRPKIIHNGRKPR